MKSIVLRTAIPGPRSLELLARRQAAVPRGVANGTPIFAARTYGATVTDVDGNVLLDFGGGIGVLNAGANQPDVVAAVHAQVDRFLHTCFHVTMYELYVRLAEKLNQLTPGTFAKKTALFNSGAEAVENAVKLARRYTGRPAVVTLSHAFHGRTLLAMSLTAKVKTYKYGFGPFSPEVYRLPGCDQYHSPFPDPAATAAAALEEIRRAVGDEIGPDKLAAVIVEPVQGESGFLVQPAEFLRGLRALCDECGAVFIADEIQTGFGRTGRFLAVEHAGIAPDIVLLSKSLADGLPLSAVTGRAEIMDSAQVGGVGGTFGGNPVACTAALAVLDAMQRDRLPDRAQAIGDRLMTRFRAWQERHPLIGDVRGLGAMCAVELVKSRRTKEPATDETSAVVKRCFEHGLIVLKAGDHDNVIRFLAPLVITDDQLDEGLEVLESAIAAVSAQTAQPVG